MHIRNLHTKCVMGIEKNKPLLSLKIKGKKKMSKKQERMRTNKTEPEKDKVIL